MLTYNHPHKIYIWRGPFETRSIPRDAGFDWSETGKCWYTANDYIAYQLVKYADKPTAAWLSNIGLMIRQSAETSPILGVEAPNGNTFYPFQEAGIEFMAQQMRGGRRNLLCADEQGLGKTVQAIGLANELRIKKLLVVCPASLRLNWVREIESWHRFNPGTDAVLTGNDKPSRHGSIVTSYNLAENLRDYKPELMIVDEAHYIKNAGAQRTQLILGNGEDWRGFVHSTRTVFLTGTPLPNGRPSELWPLLFRCAPDVISYLKYWPFLRRFCVFTEDGDEAKVTGAKRHRELFIRYRGSGFMVRRLKKDVLKDLPPKRYKMVVFPQNTSTRKVIEQEKQFSAKEIITHGVPVGTVLPEIRREMGVSKTPQCIEYIRDLLDGGTQKVVVFAHHLEVVGLLEQGFKAYKPVTIVGSTPPAKRQAAVDSFQNDVNVRVFIGNEAAEEGITLTAASDLVAVEPEWVPGKNDQRADRLHRIGQTESVMVHLLVVEGSLDAKILSAAAGKAEDSGRILGR